MSFKNAVSKRKTKPDPEVFEARRNWGARLLLELRALRKTPEWLGAQVGYAMPESMIQVINGHQGVSREVYASILRVVPEMHAVAPPPMRRVAKGSGAPGPHKPHDYPRLGPISARRPKPRATKGGA